MRIPVRDRSWEGRRRVSRQPSHASSGFGNGKHQTASVWIASADAPSLRDIVVAVRTIQPKRGYHPSYTEDRERKFQRGNAPDLDFKRNNVILQDVGTVAPRFLHSKSGRKEERYAFRPLLTRAAIQRTFARMDKPCGA